MHGVKPLYMETVKIVMESALGFVERGDIVGASERIRNAIQVATFALEEAKCQPK